MERMGLPPPEVQKWVCKQCGMETASGPLLELHIKADILFLKHACSIFRKSTKPVQS